MKFLVIGAVLLVMLGFFVVLYEVISGVLDVLTGARTRRRFWELEERVHKLEDADAP